MFKSISIATLIAGVSLTVSALAQPLSGQAYLERFQKYLKWNQTLIPTKPEPAFLSFISDDTPLANRLREKWLYQLAQQSNWPMFSLYYRPSSDVTLQCFAQMALYQQGKQSEALEGTKKIWLSGQSQPKGCDRLFTILLKNKVIGNDLLTERLALALSQRNLPMARYLLNQFSPARVNDIQILNAIYQNPKTILQLTPGGLHGELYLFGLKQMVARNIDDAIKYWYLPKTRIILNEKQQQAFLAHLTLYKAMRNQTDTPVWFAKIKPIYYNDTLLDWEIRFSLKRQHWKQVDALISNHASFHDEPCWQYWLARALEAEGQKDKAYVLYHALSLKRNYYGFLASIRLHQRMHFENEKPVTDRSILQPYQPIIDQIRALYLSNQIVQASRLLNDFIIELPSEDKTALAYWVATELHWPVKALYLTNNEELTNQLSLRFPLTHHSIVLTHAIRRQIAPELIYAIIRQESTFRDDVISSAGAHGLMQIMPATAQKIAKKEHFPYKDKKELFLANRNIAFGVAYLQELSTHFHHHPLLMVAAYNAGPRQVHYWLQNHITQQIDIWIETLPWVETRNYLKNVIAFYAVYQYRLQKKPDLNQFLQPI